MENLKLNSGGGQLVRSALGRIGFIGELYDARTEAFTSRSLFKSSLPSNLIQIQDTGRTELSCKFTENISDRFELLEVEAELQLTVLAGLIEVAGSGKFLMDEKKSQTNVSYSLLCKIRTVCEKLFASFEEIVQHVDLSALSDPDNTHVIVEINWGANCLLSAEKKYSSDSQKREVEGWLECQFKKLSSLIGAKVKGGVKSGESSFDKIEDLTIKVSADVVPEREWPTSIESFCEFLTAVPNLLKKLNNGKGKPLQYGMIPLSAIRKATKLECSVEVVVKSIDESFLMSIMCLFEEISLLKQQLYDLQKEVVKEQKYLFDKDVKEVQKQGESLKIKESDLKRIIGEDWTSVRSGTKTWRDLIRRVEKFKNYDLALFAYEDFLHSCSSIQNKLKAVKNYISYGVHYLGKGERFVDVINQNLTADIIALVISSEMEKNEPELYQNTCYYFLTLSQEKRSNTKYVVVDLDLENGGTLNADIANNNNRDSTKKGFFADIEGKQARCVHLKGVKVLSWDLFGDYLIECQSNFARIADGKEPELMNHKPGNRVVLEMTCPGFPAGSCNHEKLKWCCFRCKSNIEYGFDDYFYCSCGRGTSTSFSYRCNNPKHGPGFVQPKTEFLKRELSTLRPLKELNILILGQSGVGKSTWINSIVNYLTYDTLENAKAGGVVCTIPASFTMYDRDTLKDHLVEVGTSDESEVTTAGKSATQNAHTYNFLWEDRYVRLIDTPGLGDTRGIEQDKENMRKIISHIGHFKELHGICILMKSNDNRLNSVFSYCLKELLIHMHKSVAKNIVFCFTNARNSLYTPGQTSVVLGKLLESLGLQDSFGLGLHNRFCLDNEAFLFLCTLQYPEIRHQEEIVKSFAQSWDISLKETKRLFKTVSHFEPHSLNKTLSLVTARNRILSLTKPLAEISKTIQINLGAIEKKKDEIREAEKTLEDLSKKLYLNETKLVPVTLEYPRTVCTSPNCVNYHTYTEKNVTEVEYKTHCHTSCYLRDVPTKTINNILLKDCYAMRGGVCTVCGCGWQNHMHITFDQKRVEVQVVSKNVEDNMKKEKSSKKEIEKFVADLEERTKKYEKEQEFIIQTSVKFGMFLKENAISVYNDAIEDYLSYLIAEEENKPFKTDMDRQLLENLKNTLKNYEAEVQILQKVVNQKEEDRESLTVEQVYKLEEQLYELELSGNDIKKYVEMSRTSTSKAFNYSETPLKINPPKKSQNSVKVKKSWLPWK